MVGINIISLLISLIHITLNIIEFEEVDKAIIEYHTYEYLDKSWGAKKIDKIETTNVVFYDKYILPGGSFDWIIYYNYALEKSQKLDDVILYKDNKYTYFIIKKREHYFDDGCEYGYGEPIEKVKYIKVKNEFIKELNTFQESLDALNVKKFRINERRKIFKK